MNLSALVRAALEEDVGPGDRTTEAVVDGHLPGRAVIRAKEPLVVSGHRAAQEVFAQLAADRGVDVAYHAEVHDGGTCAEGATVARIEGPFALLLTGERVALNLLMRLSGIATLTRTYVQAAAEQVAVVDTRKTTPLHRALEKAAVRHGGGQNHRFALYDGILIKDNHILAAGGVTPAVRRARKQAPALLRIQVEVSNLEQLEQALEAGADALLLDNMGDSTLKVAVQRARELSPQVMLEASGNMNPRRIAAIKDLGLDQVSAGALIHQARWVDLSMGIEVGA